jgi:ribonuclease HI
LRLYTDGAARGNPGPAGLGVVIEDDQGLRLRGLCRYIGTATNNRAEYLALIEGLRAAQAWKPDRLEVFLDSKLVVEQVAGRWRIKNKDLLPLLRTAQELVGAFPEVTVRHVERTKNKGADALANKAIDEYKAR